ncbi:hypothetical protein Poly30_21650 [Planctomycetes bacterium Poly30]|uniref:Uncharacterized protein n=1 Tax=Saltatorellus ferox TaxID=2528018 RepID=A0A518ERD3_9BACT|nr:hypothetical protein Poly30_21650 [Planctomycetes bacterium Poly30]
MNGLAALALVSVPLSAAPALAQYGPTWSDAELLPGVRTVLHYGVHALDDGGAMTFVGEAPPTAGGFPDELVVTRYDRDGGIEWRAREPITPFIPFPGFGPAEPTLDVRGDGTSAFAVSSGDDLQVLVFGPDGAVRWRTILQATRTAYYLTAVRPFVDAGGEVVLATRESRAFFDWTTDAELMAIERFDASGASVYRVESLGRQLEAFMGTPSGDALIVSNDSASPFAPWFREIRRYDRAGNVVSMANQAGDSQLLNAMYDPRTDGVLFVTQGAAAGGGTSLEVEVYSATGSPLATGAFGTSSFGTLGSAIDVASGIAYFGGIDGTFGEVVGYDLGANEVVSALFSGANAVTVIGLRPGGGLVTLESRSTGAHVAAVSATGVRLSSTSIAPLDQAPELTQAYAAGADGRFWFAEARSRVLGSGVPSSRHVDQWVEGVAGTEYCSSPANSTGSPGHLVARGSDVATENRITLAADSLPPFQLALFLGSQTQGLTPGVGGGQGTLCLGGAIGRYVAPGQARPIEPDGRTSLEIDLTEIPTPTGFIALAAGQTWNFQLWHRDANPSGTSNLTNGVQVMLQ